MKTGQYTLTFVVIFTMVAVLSISGCKKKETYTVTFDANGGTGEMAEQIFTEGEPRALVGNLFSYQGHTFKCWNTMKNGTGTSYDDRQRITVTSDMTLYAQWKKIVTFVKVTFDANGGTGEMRPQQYVAGSPQVLRPNAFSKPDYYFHNWNTEADGSGTSYANTQEITISRSITLYAQWKYAYVDLGLPSGTHWSACNVGANSPEECGNYYAWGETTTKEDYSWTTYRWCYGDYNTLNKYCSIAHDGYNGFTDNLTVLEAADDAATANLGAGCRMPTKEEIRELYNSCTHEWTTYNGVNGMKFTGQNGNSIFFPASGYRNGRELYGEGSYAFLWASSLETFRDSDGAWTLYFATDTCYVDSFSRDCGRSVRPVSVFGTLE